MPLLPIAIGAGGSIISSIFGSSQAKKQRDANRRAEEDARAHNKEMWNLQNQYNHPSAQMARLQEAGLNPNMIYGTSPSSAVGAAGDIAKGQAPDQDFHKELDMDPMQAMLQYQNIKQSKAQVDNLRAQNDVLVQDALLKAGQTADLGVKTARGKFDFDIAKELRDTSLQAAREGVRKLQADISSTQLDVDYKDATMQDRIESIELGVKNANATLKGKKLQNALMEYDEELRAAGIERSDAVYWRILGRYLNKFREVDFEGALDGFKYRKDSFMHNARQWFD